MIPFIDENNTMKWLLISSNVTYSAIRTVVLWFLKQSFCCNVMNANEVVISSIL